MDLAEVGRIARALDGVKESSAGGSLRWTLDGRLVARQHDADSLPNASHAMVQRALQTAHNLQRNAD
jgi:hypothetical protein